MHVLQNVPPCNGGLDATKSVSLSIQAKGKLRQCRWQSLSLIAPQLAAQEPSQWQGLTFAWFWFLRFIVRSLTFAKPLCCSASCFPSPYSKYQFISTEFSFSVAVPDGGCPHTQLPWIPWHLAPTLKVPTSFQAAVLLFVIHGQNIAN